MQKKEEEEAKERKSDISGSSEGVQGQVGERRRKNDEHSKITKKIAKH